MDQQSVIPEPVAIQRFSWGGLTDEIKAEFEAILNSSTEVLSGKAIRNFVDQELGTPSPVAFLDPAFGQDETIRYVRIASLAGTLGVTPWESQDETIAEIRSLAARLRDFCDNPSHIRRVRMELHDAGVIRLEYRHKRWPGWKNSKTKNRGAAARAALAAKRAAAKVEASA